MKDTTDKNVVYEDCPYCQHNQLHIHFYLEEKSPIYTDKTSLRELVRMERVRCYEEHETFDMSFLSDAAIDLETEQRWKLDQDPFSMGQLNCEDIRKTDVSKRFIVGVKR